MRTELSVPRGEVCRQLKIVLIPAAVMPPTSKTLRGHIGFGLSVRSSVRASPCPFVTLFDACHTL